MYVKNYFINLYLGTITICTKSIKYYHKVSVLQRAGIKILEYYMQLQA